MKNVFRYLLSVFLITQGWFVSGQNHPDFDVLSIDDGFTSSRANALIQDRAGYIWVGTWNGLNRYDGYECVVFQPDNRDVQSLSNREITSLIENRQGLIWIGTTSGLNCYNPFLGQFTVIPFDTRIIALLEDRKQQLWVGTEGNGLYLVDQITGEKQQYLAGEWINAIYEDSRNEFWLATNNGLVNFDRESHSYKRYFRRQSLKNEQELSHLQVNSLVESDNGQLWAGLYTGGLVRITFNNDKDSLKFDFYREGDSPERINQLYYDQFGNLWIGSWGAGLYLLNSKEQQKAPDQARFIRYQVDVNDPYSIAGNDYISSIFVDRSGTLWVGSSLINLAGVGNQGVERVNTRQIHDGKIVNHWIRNISADRRENIWLSSSDGLFVLDRENKTLLSSQEFNADFCQFIGKNYSSVSVSSVLPDFCGLNLVATEDLGLLTFGYQSSGELSMNYKIRYHTESVPGLIDNRLSVLTPSRKYPNVVWIGTSYSGLIKGEYIDGRFRFSTYQSGSEENSLSNNTIRVIAEDRQGLVWIGTQHGLNCFNPETGSFSRYLFSIADSCTLNDNVINAIFEDSEGDLWIGSNGGLNRKMISPEGKVRFRSYPDREWIGNQIIMNILEDAHSGLWLGIYNGIIRFNKQFEKIDFEYFDKTYQRIKILNNTSYRDENGRFLLGGGTGFLRFHPDSIMKCSKPPVVRITDLLLFNKEVPVNQPIEGRVVLKQAISYTDSLVFTHKQSVITFVFSAMDFRSADKVKYAYRLEGYDKDWNQVGERNTATYTGIPPGEYRFMVKACNTQGLWSDEPKVLFIKIMPPFWKTILAYCVYGLMVVGLLYFFKRYSIIQIKEKSKLMLEKVQYEKEHELNELKVHFYTNITHEFRTPLTLILGPLQEMLEQKQHFGTYARNLELISRNANRLLRLINQLMEFRKVEKGKTELLLQEVDVVLLLVEMVDSFQNLADSKKIDFTLQYTEPSIQVWLDRDKFDKIMFNLLSNAFKFTDEGGKITIRAGNIKGSVPEDGCYIEVEDNGMGIPAGKMNQIFERFYQVNQKSTQSTGGIGLYLSKAFIELHHGTIELESEEGKGSCFRIVLPYNPETKTNGAVAGRVGNSPESGGIVEWISSKEDEDEGRIGQPETDLKEETDGEQGNSRSVVLLVEDDLDMNEFIVNSLSPSFKIKSTYNGREALEVARRINPDLVVSDIMMPEMDGLELGRLLQSDINTSHIPILYLTAKVTRENELEGLRAGAVDYIGKPFNMSTLKLKIVNILARQAAQRERFHKVTLLEPENITLSSLDEQFLKDAVAAVNNHLDDPDFDVEKLSIAIGLSQNQTYRKIKALTGQTAKEFIRNQRLKTAANLLLQKKRSVSEIIYMVGFSSPSYFTRCFREYFGVTPTEYIERGE